MTSTTDYHSDQDSGSFLTGFAVGLFAGAFGYFLFATDQGQSVRQELIKEWQLANQKLNDLEKPPTSSHDDEARASLAGSRGPIKVKKMLLEAAQNWLELDQQQAATKPKQRRAVKASKKTSDSAKTATAKKFKGV